MASFSVPCPKISALVTPQLPNPKHRNTSLVLFQSNRALVSGSSSSSLRLQATKRNQNGALKVSAELNEDVGKSTTSAPPSEKSSKKSASETTAHDVASISAFMTQVAGLVELVDSRDIMELKLKQDDCEVLIRKKEALPPPPAPQMMMMQSSQPQAMYQSQPPPPQAAPASSAPAPSASPAASPAPAKQKSSHPPLKSPMAGTFYRAPAPGAPPFAKVGDKVQKGQVVCIIEAMKLMNEIEADQSGTIVDFVAEDGKPGYASTCYRAMRRNIMKLHDECIGKVMCQIEVLEFSLLFGSLLGVLLVGMSFMRQIGFVPSSKIINYISEDAFMRSYVFVYYTFLPFFYVFGLLCCKL